jgi:hypothetical protein
MRERPTHAACAALCVGLALPNLFRASMLLLLAALAAIAFATAARVEPTILIVAALAVGGWLCGSARLEALDRSPLAPRIGTAERARVS